MKIINDARLDKNVINVISHPKNRICSDVDFILSEYDRFNFQSYNGYVFDNVMRIDTYIVEDGFDISTRFDELKYNIQNPNEYKIAFIFSNKEFIFSNKEFIFSNKEI